jgi:hypothetical protein
MGGVSHPVTFDTRARLRPLWLAIAMLVLVAAWLAPSLSADFVWDDLQQIERSQVLGGAEPLARYFTLNVVRSAGSDGRGAEGVDTFRPLFFVALEAVHAVAGRDPVAYHAAVLGMHLVVCLLVWALARRWLPDPTLAWVVIPLFGLHPVTSEAYMWASAISEPMAAAGLLAAVLLLDPGGDATDPGAGRSWGAGLLLLAGLLSKEVVLLALPAAAWWLVRGRGLEVRRLLPTGAAVAAFAVLRVHALGGVQATGADLGQRLEAARVYPVLVMDALRALVTQRPVAVRHLYWEYRDLGVVWTMAGLVVMTGLMAAAWCARRRLPLATTAISVLLAMLAPIALVATVPGWGGFGRYLYVPWAFGALAVIGLATFVAVRLRPRSRVLVWLAVAVFVTAELIGARHALAVWRSQEALAEAAIEVYDAGPDAWEWLGNVHLERGDLAAAASCYAAAVERGPGLYRPRHNLAAALLYLGRPAEALEQLDIADSLGAANDRAAAVRVEALLALGRRAEAGVVLEDARRRWPESPRLEALGAQLAPEAH